MSSRGTRVVVVSIVTIHVAMLLAYTLPSGFVPKKVVQWSQRYVRPVFHQQWMLFAPDPPNCACSIEVNRADGIWEPIEEPNSHYLIGRMARPLADHVDERILRGDTLVMPVLAKAIRNMAEGTAVNEDPSRYRLNRQCITEPSHPEARSTEFIDLEMP